jgi:hypothetical protein
MAAREAGLGRKRKAAWVSLPGFILRQAQDKARQTDSLPRNTP